MVTDFLFKNLHTKQIAIKNTFWLAIAEGMSRLLKFVLVINIARILGATEYGKFAFALSFVSLFFIFSDFGLTSITTREFSKNKEREKEYPAVFSLKILLSLTALILIIVSSFFVTVDPLIKRVIWVLAIYITISSFAEIVYAIIRARKKMEYEGMAKIIQSILITGIGIFIVKNLPSVENLSIGYLISSVIFLVVLLLFFHFKILPIKFSLQKSIWKEFLCASWPIGISLILAAIPTTAGVIIMGKMNLLSEVGWYTAARKIISVLVIPAALISQSFFPIVCRAAAESKEKLQKAWNYQILFKIIVLIPLAITALLFSHQIINLIYGQGFAPSALVLQILITNCMFIYINSNFSQILIIANKQKKIALIYLCSAIINIFLNLVLIPYLGLYGAAISLALTSLLNFLLFFLLVKKFTSIKPFSLVLPHNKTGGYPYS